MPATSPTIHQIASGTAPTVVATMAASAPTAPASTAPQPAAWWQQELAAVPAELRRIGKERVVKRRWKKGFHALAKEVLARSAADTASRPRPAVAEPPAPRCRRPTREEQEDVRTLDRLREGLRRGIGIPRPDAVIREIMATERPEGDADGAIVTCYEGFAGAGFLGIGIEQAIIAAGGRPVKVGFCEIDDDAALAYEANNVGVRRDRDITTITDGALGDPVSPWEQEWLDRLGETTKRPSDDLLDVIAGGPPCQDHSVARGHIDPADDSRIDLYGNMVRLAEIARPRLVIIENVEPAADNATVRAVLEHLRRIRYHVSTGVIDSVDLGTPQHRSRFIAIGVRQDIGPGIDVAAVVRAHRTRHHRADEVLTIGSEDAADPWSIGGARTGKTGVQARWIARCPDRPLPPLLAPPRQRRIGKSWGQTYRRMRPDEPAATLTRYFGNPANGCYMHPLEERGLSVIDGLRLQGVPAWFEMPRIISETAARRIVANGAPPQISKAIVTEAIKRGVIRV